MSQPGYGYDTPEGYQMHPPFPNLQYHPYMQPSRPASERADVSGQQNNEATHQSYEYNRNMIPGLGLGFASGVTEHQEPWGRAQPGSGYPAPQPPQHGDQSSNQEALKAGDSKKPSTMPATGNIPSDVSEEGEIGDDELEDFYEPREPDGDGNTAEGLNWPFDSGAMGAGDAMMASRDAHMTELASRSQTAGMGADRHAGHARQSSIGRERSGSYSPYLSPREINLVEPRDDSVNQGSVKALETFTSQYASSNEASKPHSSVPGGIAPTPAAVQTVSSARQQARDAILRLWPLNIRYENYLQQGVDGAVLDGLFKELGLDIPASFNAQDTSKPNVGTVAEPPATLQSVVPSQPKAPASDSEPVKAQPVEPLDKSEERKDRIARLLAAKGSKSSVKPAAAAQTATTKAPATNLKEPSAAKKQSEKSRLLQQKMEALLKAREALTQSRSQAPASAHDEASNSRIENLPISDAAAAYSNKNEGVSGSSEVPNESAEPVERSGQPSPSSIPGLFLSSTPGPPLVSEPTTRKRQSALDVTNRLAKHAKRPFGQNMESRPFLIHVSDDEDDEEMDVDSSEDHASPVNAAEASFQRPAILRDAVSTSKDGTPRPVASSPVATPPRNSGQSSGGEDLESMNKKIQEMKRKIAEAEARKKAKPARQTSPIAARANGISRDDGTGASVSHALDASMFPMTGSRTPVNDTPTESVPVPSPQARPSRSTMESKDSGYDRRSRSRAASERLPLIEARRKEQLLRLQILQSQIVNVEREIQESVAEEERLKHDLAMSGSDLDQSTSVSQSEPSSGEQLLPDQAAEGSARSDGTETKSGSPVASKDSGSSYEDSGRQIMEEVVEATADDVPPPRDSNGTESELSDTGHEAPANRGPDSVGNEIARAMQAENHEPRLVREAEEEDVVMGEADESSGDAIESGSDEYEPADVEYSAIEDVLPSPPNPLPVVENEAQPLLPSHAEPDASMAESKDQQISAGHAESSPEPGREVETVPLTQHASGHLTLAQDGQAGRVPTSEASRTHFVPYDTPLQYFRAYRFHPQFNQSVAGGLRSLTYSNKIDVQKELCPDELAGQPCPRGSQCEFQHFENMRTPDDQILLQLGAAGNYEDEKKQEYISGLRQLLTDYRNRKVKDFNTISQGIIEYRAQFEGDRSKILPLGSVSI